MRPRAAAQRGVTFLQCSSPADTLTHPVTEEPLRGAERRRRRRRLRRGGGVPLRASLISDILPQRLAESPAGGGSEKAQFI